MYKTVFHLYQMQKSFLAYFYLHCYSKKFMNYNIKKYFFIVFLK
ncbi:hypothetical protein K661_01587 [Piscirickettsia salmonis LF-89 = ATCC VR-1361]|nr:hypothetical protein K661_01587 [Piscirickettsia salmonis LF-89 = ATCC VR-1361]